MENPSPLVNMRRKSGVSQDAIATEMGITQSAVSRLERFPNRATMEQILAYSAAIGADPREVFAAARASLVSSNLVPTQHLALVVPDDTYEEPWIEIERFCEGVRHRWAALPKTGELAAVAAMSLELETSTEALKYDIKDPPRLAFAGITSAGKTTLINALLGLNENQRLPTTLGRTTKWPTFIRHTELRPHWLNEEPYSNSDWFVFSDSFSADTWFSSENKPHLRSHGTLEAFAKESHVADDPCDCALLFLDAPPLRSITLIDLPGFQSSAEESARIDRHVKRLDAMVYCSRINAFALFEDRMKLQQLVQRFSNLTLPKSQRLCLAATWADSARHKSEEMWEAIDEVLPALARQLDDQGESFSIELLKRQTYLFWVEDEDSQLLSRHLSSLIATELPPSWKARATEKLQEYRSRATGNIGLAIDQHQEMLRSLSTLKTDYAVLLGQESLRRRQAQLELKQLLARVEELRVRSSGGSLAAMKRYSDEPQVMALLNNREYAGAQEAQEHFFSDVLANFNGEVVRCIRKAAKSARRDIERFIGNLQGIFATSKSQVLIGNFDVRRVFEEHYSMRDDPLEMLNSKKISEQARASSFFGFGFGAIRSLSALYLSAKMRAKLWKARLVDTICRTMSSASVRKDMLARNDAIWHAISSNIEAAYNDLENRWAVYLSGLSELSKVAPAASERRLTSLVDQLADLRKFLKEARFLGKHLP